MVSTQFSVNKIGDFQFLYVPRRDSITGDVEWDQSSLAGKLHLARGTTEFDIMVAEHYSDKVVGFGSSGYLGDSWVWWKKNFYGFLEFYFNGLCDNHYTDAFTDQHISERLERGELYTLGRTYLGGHIRVELHPLFNVYLTVINNLADHSGTMQPRAVWDIAEAIQITLGGNLHYGRRGTEYGGFQIPGTNLLHKAPNSAFLWLSYFF
jgi:hypothetical protein